MKRSLAVSIIALTASLQGASAVALLDAPRGFTSRGTLTLTQNDDVKSTVMCVPKKDPSGVVIEGSCVEKAVAWTTLSEAKRRQLLSNEEEIITLEKSDKSVGLKLAISQIGGALNLSKGTYRYSYTWMRYRTVACTSADGKKKGTGRVGVGVQLNATITTTSSSADLGGIIPIAVSAARKQLSGTMSTRLIGLSSPLLTGLGGTAITPESAVSAEKHIAVIKSLLLAADDRNPTTTVKQLAVEGMTPEECVVQDAQPTGLSKAVAPAQ
jgi:hypothetical protein